MAVGVVKRWLTLLGWSLTPLAVWATDTDSLINRLATVQDTARVNVLNCLSKAYRYQNAAVSQHYADSAYQASVALHYPEGKGWALINRGVVALLRNDTDTTETLAQEALTIFRQLAHPHGTGTSLNSLGMWRITGGSTIRQPYTTVGHCRCFGRRGTDKNKQSATLT